MSDSTATQFNIQIGDELTWNVMPLLHEVKHAMDKLINQNETSVIDLRSIPLAPGEEDKILNLLGCGEVQSQLNALGLSEINETQYAGVWIVTHYNDEDDIIGRFIEVTFIPEILRSQQEDVLESYKHLAETLASNQESNDSLMEKSA